MEITMLKVTIFSILSFISLAAIADPEWFHGELTEAECNQVEGPDYEKAMCLTEFYNQKITYLSHFIRMELAGIDPTPTIGDCKESEILTAWTEHEAALYAFEKSKYILNNICTGPQCGSGHASAWTFEEMEISKRTLSRYDSYFKNGISTWGCEIKFDTSQAILETEKFRITINGKCEFGLVNCDHLIYVGVNKNTEDSITLNGKTIINKPSEFDKKPVGFSFLNGNFEYKVLFDGKLIVVDRKGGKILLEEQGKWTVPEESVNGS